MKVCEIFSSIQGESSHAGLPCTFIRLTGCNLRCTYCDTEYAYEEGVEYSVGDILMEVRLRGVGLVEITGGEPLLQEEVPGLAKSLLDEGYTLLIETNGTVPVGGLDSRAMLIMDIKTPGSGALGSFHMENLGFLKPSDEVKFVIVDRADYEWARDFIYRHSLPEKCGVLISPAYGILQAEKLAGWILEDKLDVRLNLQLHKYIYGPERRAV